VRTRGEDRRAAILRAAAELFAARGFRSVSIEDLGRAVGTTGPALYRHFPGKEALLAEVLLDISERLLRQGTEHVAAHPDPNDALDALLRGHIAFALAEPALITVHDRELLHVPEEPRRKIRRLQRAYLEQWVDVLAAVRPTPPRRCCAPRCTPRSACSTRPRTARGNWTGTIWPSCCSRWPARHCSPRGSSPRACLAP